MAQLIDQMKAKNGFACLKSVADKQISEAEQQLGVKLSQEYHEYISSCGVASLDGHELTGICSSSRLNLVDVTRKKRGRNSLVPATLYVI